VAAPSKAWVWGSSLAGIAGSNPAGAGMSVVKNVYCQECISATNDPRPKESYRTYIFVLLTVIRCNNNHLHPNK